MDRESFLRGVDALRQQIAAMEVVQRRDKKIIRMPRKTSEDREALMLALNEREKGKRYMRPDVGWVQHDIEVQKVWITALLVTYNLVRGKGVPYRVDKYCRAEYTLRLQEARKIFDNAVAAVPVG